MDDLNNITFKASRPKATKPQIDYIMDLIDQAQDYFTTKDCEYVDSLTKDLSKLTMDDARVLISFLLDKLPDPYEDWGTYYDYEDV